jgi:ankyrin repeat protein
MTAATPPTEALFDAVRRGDADLVRGLIEAQLALVSARNGQGESGFTALHEAAFKDDAALARLLLAHGADVSIATGEGETAVTIATRTGHPELARLLAGASR